MFKNLLFTIYYFLFPISYSIGGWLLWESVEFIPPDKNEKTVKDLNSIISQIPQTALNTKNQTIDITIAIISRQSDIHRFLNEIGWQEISTDMLKSVSDALKEITSGRQLSKFPPARKWFIKNKKQDLSLAKHFDDRRVELYIWRSPFKVMDSPLWYGAIAELKFFQDEVKKSAKINKKIKVRSVPRGNVDGQKIKKKNLLVLEISIY